ncbi:unnamed protein product [Coregonus sp. 'balchen']|nr:unnamed protein product [Coregonus sp. 'balchen']
MTGPLKSNCQSRGGDGGEMEIETVGETEVEMEGESHKSLPEKAVKASRIKFILVCDCAFTGQRLYCSTSRAFVSEQKDRWLELTLALIKCLVANKTCPKNHSWSNRLCRCMAVQRDTPPPPQTQHSDKELDEETCQCVCRRQLRASGTCGPHRYLDKNTCQCVCKTLPSSCGPHQIFNKDTCQCSCGRTCPKHQPLNRSKCACECNESPNRCFLKGKRFHQATCR